MTEAPQLSEAKRRLLGEYLRRNGDHSRALQRPIPRRPPDEPVPLSFAQEQVWVHSQMAGDIPIYNEAFTVYHRGPVNIDVLERSFAEIIRRHEIWRTTIHVADGKPFQVVHPPADRFPIAFVDLRDGGDQDAESKASRLATSHTRLPFSFDRYPLLRVLLARLGDDDYRLYVTVHHVIFDGASIYRVFLSELASIYDALAAGKPAILPELPLQYGDFAYWQRKASADEEWSKELSFWREELAGDPPVLQWPHGQPRARHQMHRGALQRFEFNNALVERLRAFSRQQHVSSYMTCLASFAALLSRYSGQEEIIIGCLSAGRNRPELEALMGYFVNPVALRLDLAGNPSFAELVLRARDTLLNALGNDRVSFGKVVEALRLRPDPNRNPIFQIILTQQPPVAEVGTDWHLVIEEVSNGCSKLDLTVVLDEREKAIGGPITYNPDLFEAETITRMVRHWQAILEAALTYPDRPVTELEFIDDLESHRVLSEWNNTHVDYPDNLCLHQLFEEQAQRNPSALAVQFEEQRLTYVELELRATRLAGLLQSFGVGPNVAVGLFVERSLELIVGLLSILKAGGICVPLDPAYPTDRLALMLADTSAPVVLVQPTLASRLSSPGVQVVLLDGQTQARATSTRPVLNRTVTARNIAYIIYTSGSTGRPKGVPLNHAGLVNSTLARITYYKEPVKRFLLLSSHSFDSSLAGIFWTLAIGGALVLPPDQSRWNLQGLVDLIERKGVSHVLCVPALYRQILEAARSEQLASIRFAIVAGEQCPRDLVEHHYRMNPEADLYNEYGPTEATVWSSVYRCPPEPGGLRVPIGRPIANTQLYVVDRYLRPVPVGIPGELCIGGSGVTSGYLNDDELSAKKFVPNPLGGPGSRLYKTGDVARYLPDGNLVLLGRADNQIKLRGFRIELEEIESVISSFPGVRQVAVSLLRDTHDLLVAYVVADSSGFHVEGLRAFLRNRLPDAMVPTSFVTLEQLPVLPNGKVDRRALPAPQPSPTHTKFRTAQDALESGLVEIWQDLLKTAPIGVDDNFFELGGNSLLLVMLILRIERAYGRSVSLRDFAQAPTIREIAALLRQGNQAGGNSGIIPIQAQGTKPPLFWVRGGPLFLPLAHRLGLDQPVLGLHLPAIEASQLPRPYKLQDIAGMLVRHVQKVQPEGPYHLAGLCVNGVIAYEMALQLIAQGQEVALLALFDAQNPQCYRDFSQESRTRLLYRKIIFHLTNLRGLEKAELLEFARERLEGVRRRISFARGMLHYTFGLAVKQDNLEDLDTIVHPASYTYRPNRYPGRVAFFQSTHWPVGRYWLFYTSWSEFIDGDLEVHYIPGGHESMFHEPNVDLLAEKLDMCLSRAWGRTALAVSPTVDYAEETPALGLEPALPKR